MMIDKILKNSFLDIWDEFFYVLIFNLFWLGSVVLILPFPFVTFGLFATFNDIGQGKSIKFGTLFKNIAQLQSQAAIWGATNLLVFMVALLGLYIFGMASPWWIIIGLIFHWTILQLIVLALYSHLKEPDLKTALHDAMVVAGSYPLGIFALIILIVIMGATSLIVPGAIFIGSFTLIIAFTNRLVEAVVAQSKKVL